jgi:hypothetical protein
MFIRSYEELCKEFYEKVYRVGVHIELELGCQAVPVA